MNQPLQKIINKIQKDEVYRIVFYGDSITSAEWVHPNWREMVEYVLNEEIAEILDDWELPSWRVRCFNSAMDGATSKDLLDNLNEYIFNLNPDLTILMAGKNDLHNKITVKQHNENIKDLCNQISKESDFVFLSSAPSLDAKITKLFSEYTRQYDEITNELGIKFINTFNKYQKFDLSKMFTFELPFDNDLINRKKGDTDPLHPNQIGNAYIAKVFLEEYFEIDFNPDKYIKETLEGAMYPEYK